MTFCNMASEMPSQAQPTRLLRFVEKHGMVRARDLATVGIHRTVLQRLVTEGRLIQRSRGIYTTPEYEPTEHTDLAAVALRVPAATICLLSALRFHELTTQNPFEVWIMIDKFAHRPVIDQPPVRVVLASGEALSAGVDTRKVEGVKLRVTNPAKTVADCFRYRRIVGTDVAMEALRDCWRQRKATMDEIHHYAKVDRVANFMRPYMEAMVA
jgi:predicted transcriptional regulator of viral defense system